MRNVVLAITLSIVMLTTVLAAGCTSPLTSSPTPTPSEQTGSATATGTPTVTVSPTAAGQQTVTQYLTAIVQQQNFVVVTPFVQQQSVQPGVAIYNCTVKDQNGTYIVSVQACNDLQTAQAQFLAQQTLFINQGYVQVQQTATTWYAFNSQTQQGCEIEYGTSPLIPYYCMVTTGGSNGQTTFQPVMFQHVVIQLHEKVSNGDGFGQNLGQGADSDTRAKIQQQVKVHINNAK